jgi:hypothetical protein
MFRSTRILAVVLAVLGAGRACAQVPAGARSAYPFATPPARFDSPYAVYDCGPSGPPACAPYEDHNGPLLHGDALLDYPPWAPPGWYAGVEVDLVGPHIKNRMFQFVGPDLVHLATPLDWTAAPEFTLGYRFGQAGGELLVTYRSLDSSGSGTAPAFDAAGSPGALRGHVDLHVVNFDYASREFSLGPVCDMKWFAGLTWATVDFHSNAESALMAQAVSNNYWGLGPHFGLNLSRTFCPTGIDVLCRFDIAWLYGPVTETFQEFFSPAGLAVQVPPGSDLGGEFRQRHNHLTPVPRLEVGVGWRPPGYEQLHFATGYLLEQWFDFENNDGPPPSRGGMTIQGVFVRGEWRY